MLWVDRVGNRRSPAILAAKFSEKKGDQHETAENERRTKELLSHQGETRDGNHDKKRRRNNVESFTALIDVQGLRHDYIFQRRCAPTLFTSPERLSTSHWNPPFTSPE